MVAMARWLAVVAAAAACVCAARAGGWGLADCGNGDRERMLELAEECGFRAFDSKASGVPDRDDQRCPAGCFCNGLGDASVAIGTSANCLPVRFGADGKSIAANDGCTSGGGCECVADACEYSCDDISGKACVDQLDDDQDERSSISKFFDARNIAIVSSAGAGALLLALCLCCCCCCAARKCRKGKDDDGDF